MRSIVEKASSEMAGQRCNERLVKDANQQLYDAVADRYEAVDGRRSARLEEWLRSRLVALRRRAPGGGLLDLGAGCGFVTRCARGVFDFRVALDLSPRVLGAARENAEAVVAADVDALPFAPSSFDAVTCFATLHHLYRFDTLTREVARVLRPGGVFYSDHDLDAAFHRRFRAPLWVYRKVRNRKGAFASSSGGLACGLYDLAEYHSKGIPADEVVRLLVGAGFAVEVGFHWFGLSGLFDRIFGDRSWRRGWAPLVAIVATLRSQP